MFLYKKTLSILYASPHISPHPLHFSSSADRGPSLHPLCSSKVISTAASWPSKQKEQGTASVLWQLPGCCSTASRGVPPAHELGSMEVKEASSGARWEQHGVAAHTAHQQALTKRVSLPGRAAAGIWGNTRGENGEKMERPAFPREAESFPSTQNALTQCYCCPHSPLPQRKAHCPPLLSVMEADALHTQTHYKQLLRIIPCRNQVQATLLCLRTMDCGE